MTSDHQDKHEVPHWVGTFRRLAENAPAILFQFRMATDGSLSLPYVSGQVKALAGVEAEEIMQDASVILRFLHPEDVALFNEAVQESAARMDSFHLEFRGLRGGDTVWVEAHSVPEAQPDGSILWDGILTDVTQRKRAEAALRESEERYHTFVQRSSEGIYRVELDQPVPVDLPVDEQVDLFYDRAWMAECNQRFAEMYGAESCEALLGRRVEEFHGGRDHPKNRPHLERLVAAGYRLAGEVTEEPTLAGETRFFSNSIFGIVEDGKLVRLCGSQADVTEQRAAEERIRSQESILREIAANYPNSYLSIIEKDLTVGFTSGQAFRRRGLDPETFVGMSLEEVFGEHSQKVERNYLRTFQGEETSFELLMGDEVQSYRTVPLFAEDGTIPRILAVAEDVTEARRAQAEVEERAWRIARQNEILAQVASSPSVREGDVHGLAVKITEAVATAFGIERVGVWLFREEGTELTCIDLYEATPARHSSGAVLTAQEYGDEFRHLQEAKYTDAHDALSDPRVAGYAERYFKPLGITSMLDGVIRAGGDTVGVLCLEHVDRPHQWTSDEIAFVCQLADQVGMALQDRERRRAQATLRESEARWHFALEGAGDGVWDWNAETDEVFYSRQWKAMLGYGENEIGNTFSEWRDRVHPEDLDRALEAVRRHLEGETETYVSEHRLRCKDGSYKWVLDRGKVLTRDQDHRPLRIIGIHSDITERKRAERERERLQAQLLQSQKMESVGRLAGGVAHDFNNMLSVILGHSELALDRLDPSEELYGDLLEVQKAGLRSADLTRQLLAFARLQTVAPKVLDLNETAGGMLKMLQRLIGEAIELVWSPAPGLWPVRMDAAQLDQVLANLCVNARDAIADVGSITIETRNVTLDEEACAHQPGLYPGDYVALTVRDNGMGMKEEVLEHLFEPFFTTKRVGEGTGLGLATVYGIVKQNDGFIQVESELGVGTTFRIYLPRVPGEAREPSSGEAGAPPRARGETVLLVEDEEAILKVGKAMLSQLGYAVLGALTPMEAMERARDPSQTIDLLITDVVMPGMNGRQLASRVQEIRPELKTLFVSGYTADVIAHHGVLDAEVHFIQKPFSLRELAFKVREALGS